MMNSKPVAAFRRIGLGLTWVVAGPLVAQTTGGPESVPLPALTCSPEKPVITENSTLTLWAWVKPQAGGKPRYEWNADAGTITGRDHEVQWSLTGAPPRPRPYQATVKVSLPSGESASCSVQVFITEKERGTRETGREFLVKGANEDPDYGLYSYLLLGSRPTTSNRERYLRAVNAYLSAIERVASLEEYLPSNRLNIAYLPVEVKADGDRSADWLLDKYDYARARALLNALPGSLREGPYLISVLKPLRPGSPVEHYLFQDLSAVPAKDGDLISWWMREFLNQAAQERYWEPRTAALLALKVRTTIGVMAEGLPDVQKALAGWISWLH